MIKRILGVLLMVAMTVSHVSALDGEPVFDVEGSELTDLEMETYTGRLYIFGVEILPRIKRFNRRKKPSNPAKEHCDIIAKNRAESLGLNTNDQSGKARNYNAIKVNEIYSGYPANRHSTPPEGTSGYYFSSYGTEKEHMGVYSRQSGSSDYTRYMNQSMEGTETMASVKTSYVPQDVTSQRFVPLPRRESHELYYR